MCHGRNINRWVWMRRDSGSSSTWRFSSDTDIPWVSARLVARRPERCAGSNAAGHDAAVDVENRAGDPAGLVGEQIGDGVGDVGGGADSSQGMKRCEGVKRGVDLVLGDKPLQSGGLDGG